MSIFSSDRNEWQCKYCKWWGRPGQYGAPITGSNMHRKRHCGLYVYPLNGVEQQSYLDAGDFASSDGSLWTDPDFFCAKYEDRVE